MVWYGRDGSRCQLCPGHETPPSRAKLDLNRGKVRPRRASCRPEFSVLRAVYEGVWINKISTSPKHHHPSKLQLLALKSIPRIGRSAREHPRRLARTLHRLLELRDLYRTPGVRAALERLCTPRQIALFGAGSWGCRQWPTRAEESLQTGGRCRRPVGSRKTSKTTATGGSRIMQFFVQK